MGLLKKTGKTVKRKESLLKRFVGNRNVVTLLGLAACVATLVIGYNYRVNKAISPNTIPYAKESIPSRTLITPDMVGMIKVASSYINQATNVVRTDREVLNKYVSYKTNIPQGSLFYKESLKEADEMPDAAFANIADGYTIFSLKVTVEDTFANSIRAGDYIDIYMSATDTSGLVIYGPFIESIRVLAVKDNAGKNILKNTLAYGTPSELLFAVEDELFELLVEGENVNGNVKFHPFIRNSKYTAQAGETSVSSEQLRQFIKDQVEDYE